MFSPKQLTRKIIKFLVEKKMLQKTECTVSFLHTYLGLILFSIYCCFSVCTTKSIKLNSRFISFLNGISSIHFKHQ